MFSRPLLLVLLVVPAAGYADNALCERITAYFEALADAGDFNGQVYVRRDDQFECQRAFSGLPANNMSMDRPLAIASLTKTFTSGAILALEASDQVDLDDPVSRYIEGIPSGDDMTVRHLLLHASGLQNPDTNEIGDRKLSSEELMVHIAARPLHFEPGSESRYSNAGYSVLARVIEVAGHKPYPDYLREQFWTPLGMDKTLDGSEASAASAISAGHIPAPGAPKRNAPANYSAALGAGSILSTATDLGRWLQAVGDRRYFDIFDQEWPYGWGKAEVLGHEGIEQTGAIEGHVSVMQVYPDEGLLIAILSNIENGSWGRWGNDVATLVFGGDVQPPVMGPAIPLTDQLRTATLGTYEGDGWTAHVRDEDGFLWVYWNEYPTGKYLKHMGDGIFAIPSDTGQIQFHDLDGGAYHRFEWQFPGGGKLIMERKKLDEEEL